MALRKTPPAAPVTVPDRTEIPAPTRPGQLREARTEIMRQFDAAHRTLHQLG